MLREEIVKAIKNSKKTDLSLESLTSFVLHSLSKNHYFKENYNHIELIEKDGEIRAFSTPLNEIYGVQNQTLAWQVISPYQDEEKEDLFWLSPEELKEKEEFENSKESKSTNLEDEDNYYDDYDYYYNETPKKLEDCKILLSNEKLNSIKTFFSHLESSNTFKDLLKKLGQENDNIYLDIEQNIVRMFLYESKIKNFKELFSLVKHIDIYKSKSGFFEMSNNRSHFGSTNARDILNCFSLEGLATSNDLKHIKKVINNESLWGLRELLIDEKLNKVPEEINQIIENQEIENWQAIKLFIGSNKKYENKLLNTVLQEKKNKHIEIIEIYFKNLKEKALVDKNFILERFSNKEETLNKYKENIEEITNVIEEKFLREKNPEIKIDINEFKPVGNWSVPFQKILLEEYSKDLSIYTNYNHDVACKGLRFATDSNFDSIKDKDNILITLTTDNDIIGFGSFYIMDNQVRVNTVNVATHHRGQKAIKQVYEKIIEYSIEKNLPLHTSMYTTTGSNRLPKMKRELLNKYKDALWLDTCSNVHQTPVEKTLSTLNNSIFRIIQSQPNLKMKDFRKIYDEEKLKLEKHVKDNEIYWDKRYELTEELISNVQKKAESLNKKRNKKNKRKL